MSWKNNGYLAAAVLVLLLVLVLLPVEGDLMALLGSLFVVLLALLPISLSITLFGAIRRSVRARRKKSRTKSSDR